MNKYFLLVLTAAVLSAQPVLAQPTRSGTYLNSKAMPSEVVEFQQPDEVEAIRQFLVDGRKNDALIAAEAYLKEVDRTRLNEETLPRYYAWNAYCTVLTSLGRADEAVDACTTAMKFEPEKWSAVNNRGTAKFVGGQLQEALADYQKALSMVDDENVHVRETIQHNIQLVAERGAGK